MRSFTLERRLDAVVGLIRAGRHNAPSLADALGVSVPTVSRCLVALRRRGFVIRSVRDQDGCRYVISKAPGRTAQRVRGGDPSHATA